MKKLGILLSGRGSNFLAIANAIRLEILKDVEIAVVLSNKEDAPGLAVAREMGLLALAIPSAGKSRAEHDAAMISELQANNVDLVCLAGYMRIISPEFVAAFPDRILNVHPSLLPSFPGLEAQTQALEFGAKVAGCTVHFVDEKVDHGVIVLQRAVPVEDDDTAETLSARILEQEHLAYPEAIARVVSGEVSDSGAAVFEELVASTPHLAVKLPDVGYSVSAGRLTSHPSQRTRWKGTRAMAALYTFHQQIPLRE